MRGWKWGSSGCDEAGISSLQEYRESLKKLANGYLICYGGSNGGLFSYGTKVCNGFRVPATQSFNH